MPLLRTIFSIVGGDEAARHGVVLAKSMLAKKYGIVTAEPLAAARRKCPGLVFVPPDCHYYVKKSGKFIRFLEKYGPSVEQYSIDEVFCDMSGTEGFITRKWMRFRQNMYGGGCLPDPAAHLLRALLQRVDS